MVRNKLTLGTSGDFQVTTNWSAGTKGAAGEDIDVTHAIGTDVTNCEAIGASDDYASVHIGGPFFGKLATAAAPWYIGSTALVEIDAPITPEIHLGVGTGKTITAMLVKRNAGTQLATVVYGTGTISLLVCTSGVTVIESNAVITKLEVSGTAVVIIKSGATIGAIDQAGGSITNYAAITNDVNLAGGTFNHAGDTTFNIGGVLRVAGGKFHWAANGGTIATALLSSGLLNLNAGWGSPARVISAFRQTGGKLDKSGLGANVTLTASTYVAGDLAA